MQTNVVALYSYTHTKACLFNTVSSLVLWMWIKTQNKSSLSLTLYPIKVLNMQPCISWGNPWSQREKIAIYLFLLVFLFLTTFKFFCWVQLSAPKSHFCCFTCAFTSFLLYRAVFLKITSYESHEVITLDSVTILDGCTLLHVYTYVRSCVWQQ